MTLQFGILSLTTWYGAFTIPFFFSMIRLPRVERHYLRRVVACLGKFRYRILEFEELRRDF